MSGGQECSPRPVFLLLPWADRRSGHGLRRQSRCRQSSAASRSILTNRALQRPACSLPLAASLRGFRLCSQHAPGDSFLYLSRFGPEDRNCSRYSGGKGFTVVTWRLIEPPSEPQGWWWWPQTQGDALPASRNSGSESPRSLPQVRRALGGTWEGGFQEPAPLARGQARARRACEGRPCCPPRRLWGPEPFLASCESPLCEGVRGCCQHTTQPLLKRGGRRTLGNTGKAPSECCCWAYRWRHVLSGSECETHAQITFYFIIVFMYRL